MENLENQVEKNYPVLEGNLLKHLLIPFYTTRKIMKEKPFFKINGQLNKYFGALEGSLIIDIVRLGVVYAGAGYIIYKIGESIFGK